MSLHATTQETDKPIVYVLLGPPGSGKGTLAVELSKREKIPHISTGDLFRENLRNKTELGLEAQQYLDKGLLVPDNLVLDILFDRVSQPDCKEGYILDGMPRNIPQAHELEDYLRKKARVLAINLVVSDEIVIDRLGGRLVCTSCNRTYHIKTNPPKVPGVCSACGGELIQRTDDKPEVIKERLKIYYEQTKPLEKFYQDAGILRNIDAALPPEKILEQVQNIINAYKEPTKTT